MEVFIERPMAGGLCRVESGFDRLDKKHLIGRAKSARFVEAAPLFRGVEGNDADAAASGLSQCEVDEVAGEAAAAMIGLDVNVEKITTGGGARVEWVRRPVEDEQASTGDDNAIVFREPAEIAAVGDGLRYPGLVGLGHKLEHLVVATAGIDKHAPAMVGDERSVGGRREPGLQHDEQYRALGW